MTIHTSRITAEALLKVDISNRGRLLSTRVEGDLNERDAEALDRYFMRQTPLNTAQVGQLLALRDGDLKWWRKVILALRKHGTPVKDPLWPPLLGICMSPDVWTHYTPVSLVEAAIRADPIQIPYASFPEPRA